MTQKFFLTMMICIVLGIISFAALAGIRTFAFSQQPLALEQETGNFQYNDVVGEFYGNTLASRVVAENPQPKNVLGVSNEEKRIEVDLTNQRLYAFEGNNKIYDFLISSGKWGRTPTGEFRIWIKLKYTKMSGGSKELGTYYYLPNVPYTMFFSNDKVPSWRGFGIHGTYWHSNFGTPMSHGCINMKTEEAEKIFYWAAPDLGGKSTVRATADNPGTKIIIYGTAP
jgi:lipoprotein-anchoring transpeptidase ErfK/SrfK